jgi:TatD DNase family protein
LPRIAQTLAELRGLGVDAVAQATTRNARELFRLA